MLWALGDCLIIGWIVGFVAIVANMYFPRALIGVPGGPEIPRARVVK